MKCTDGNTGSLSLSVLNHCSAECFPDNPPELYWPYIIGVRPLSLSLSLSYFWFYQFYHSSSSYLSISAVDITVLVSLVIHRSSLIRLGLWRHDVRFWNTKVGNERERMEEREMKC